MGFFLRDSYIHLIAWNPHHRDPSYSQGGPLQQKHHIYLSEEFPFIPDEDACGLSLRHIVRATHRAIRTAMKFARLLGEKRVYPILHCKSVILHTSRLIVQNIMWPIYNNFLLQTVKT